MKRFEGHLHIKLMKYLLVEPKGKRIAPNIALMKWARWCDLNGHEYEYVVDEVIPEMRRPDFIFMSCIFSFNSRRYEQTIRHYRRLYPYAKWRIGGAFATNGYEYWMKLKRELFSNSLFAEPDDFLIHKGTCDEIENLIPKYSIDKVNDAIVLYSSRGCTNKCKYCTVPLLEGDMNCFTSIKPTLEAGLKEVNNPRCVVLYDNNFTAHENMSLIIDEIVDCGLPVDIHGLHVSEMDDYKAEQLARLKWGSQTEAGVPYMRFSYDKISYKKHVDNALRLTVKHGIKAGFFCYLLYNFKDSPLDFWRRLVYSQQMVDKYQKSIILFPQRYEPLDALYRNSYVGKRWQSDTQWEGDDLVRGISKFYTYLHGFLPLTKSRSLFKWLGFSYEEFLENSLNFVRIKDYVPIKKDVEPPPTEQMVKELEAL